jgi:hypothetical protein
MTIGAIIATAAVWALCAWCIRAKTPGEWIAAPFIVALEVIAQVAELRGRE